MSKLLNLLELYSKFILTCGAGGGIYGAADTYNSSCYDDPCLRIKNSMIVGSLEGSVVGIFFGLFAPFGTVGIAVGKIMEYNKDDDKDVIDDT